MKSNLTVWPLKSIQMYKRENDVWIYWDNENQKFQKWKDGKCKQGTVVLINCCKVCEEIIQEYLNQPAIKKYKRNCIEERNKSKNPINAFLWYFENIDGAYDFELFEIECILSYIQKWCKANGLNYVEPEAWTPENYVGSFLTMERKKI